MIQIFTRDGESTDRMIKRLSGHIKSTGLAKVIRKGRYFAQKPTKKKVRETAVSRERYRAAAKKRQFLG